MALNEILLGLIVSIIGLLGVLLGTFVSHRVAKSQIKVEAITKERISWLDELRGIIADILSSCAVVRLHKPSEVGAQEIVEIFERANLHNLRLKLHLNPEGNLEMPVLRASDKLFVAANGGEGSYAEAQNELVASARKLLKAEWEKAKKEANA